MRNRARTHALHKERSYGRGMETTHHRDHPTPGSTDPQHAGASHSLPTPLGPALSPTGEGALTRRTRPYHAPQSAFMNSSWAHTTTHMPHLCVLRLAAGCVGRLVLAIISCAHPCVAPQAGCCSSLPPGIYQIKQRCVFNKCDWPE